MRTLALILQALLFLALLSPAQALDIGPMTWTPRSDWISVKNCTTLTGGPNAQGDGVADDTKAIQGVLNYIKTNRYGRRLTIYFPAGTYKITDTLTITDLGGVQVIGCGRDTTLRWDGARGGAMFWPNSTDFMRYIGLTWDGNNLAGCAYEHNSALGGYETQIRHENESFKNFTVPGNYTYTNANGHTTTETAPAAAIISGFAGSQVTGETMIYNCKFDHCGTGVINAYQTYQNYMWHIDACEFDNCGDGINMFRGGCFVISNCHFQESTGTDINGGFGLHVRHCTSSGSNKFYGEGQNASLSQSVFQDCWVDGWKGTPGGAIRFASYGSNSVFDCSFTHPPAGASGVIQQDQAHGLILLSNNIAPDFPKDAGIIGGNKPDVTTIVPPGAKSGCLKSATQTFLKPTWPADSTHILDVTADPYKADPTNATDSTAAIQTAINDAKKAANGSVVYFPPGLYKITSTLHASGGNYTIQGAGTHSELCWYGPDNGTMLALDTPQNIKVETIECASLLNQPGQHGYEPKLPPSNGHTVIGIKETSTGPSSAIYDDYSYYAFFNNSPGAIQDNMNGPGLVLSGLGATSRVYIPHSVTPLVVQDSSEARIFILFFQNGAVHVSGTTPKTGFLGALVAEGGQQPDLHGANFTIDDNQNLVLGDYYTEQTRDDVRLLRGKGTTDGSVTIQGWVSAAGQNDGTGNGSTTTVAVDNYAGQLFYGPQDFSNNTAKSPVLITHTGTNPFNLTLVADTFEAGNPIMKLGPGAHLIQTLCQLDTPPLPNHMPETPNPLAPADLVALSKGLDHLRELEAVDLEFEFGMGGQQH
jgi:hypothetical protein